MRKATEYLKNPMQLIETEEVLRSNEKQANILVAKTMIICSIAIAVSWVLNMVGIFMIEKGTMNLIAGGMIIIMMPIAIYTLRRGNNTRQLKYPLMLILIVVLGSCFNILTYNFELGIVIPLLLSIRYYDKKFCIYTAVLSVIMFSGAVFFSYDYGFYDKNFIDTALETPHTFTFDGSMMLKDLLHDFVDPSAYRWEYFSMHYLPNVIVIIVLTIAAAIIADRGRQMVIEQNDVAKRNANIETELGIATNIQSDMLPRIFPPFPNRKDFDIYARMTPAKEVGGDFYDFFLLDEDHLGMVIADVSGKGVPAALFMMTSKTLIKDHTLLDSNAGRVFEEVNNILCEGNEAGLFVTAFLAVINLKTGRVHTVNAGHNPPVIRCSGKFANGEDAAGDRFEYMPTKPGFVLAGMEGMKYKESAFNIYPGDCIFFYTDGVTEATDKDNNLYGEDRLIEFMNSRRFESAEDMIDGVEESVMGFTGDAEQFDDTTMLAFKYKGPDGNSDIDAFSSVTYPAELDNIKFVMEFVEGFANRYDAPSAVVSQFDIAIDEILSNICKFAYESGPGKGVTGNMTVDMEAIDGGLKITIKDNGAPFNPLEAEERDITLSAEERPIGGLGLMIVKKQMTSVDYRYENETNILTLTKVFKAE